MEKTTRMEKPTLKRLFRQRNLWREHKKSITSPSGMVSASKWSLRSSITKDRYSLRAPTDSCLSGTSTNHRFSRRLSTS